MKYNDHEFDPVTDEERAAREREEELARRIRREVLRVQSGEATRKFVPTGSGSRPKRRPGRRSSARRSAAARTLFWLSCFSGNILVRKGAVGILSLH